MNTIELKQDYTYITKRKNSDHEDSKYRCITVKYISDTYVVYLEDKYARCPYEQTTTVKRFNKLYTVEEVVEAAPERCEGECNPC